MNAIIWLIYNGLLIVTGLLIIKIKKRKKKGSKKMNELQDFKNLIKEIKKNIILLVEELKKELEKEEAKKNDNIDNN